MYQSDLSLIVYLWYMIDTAQSVRYYGHITPSEKLVSGFALDQFSLGCPPDWAVSYTNFSCHSNNSIESIVIIVIVTVRFFLRIPIDNFSVQIV